MRFRLLSFLLLVGILTSACGDGTLSRARAEQLIRENAGFPKIATERVSLSKNWQSGSPDANLPKSAEFAGLEQAGFITYTVQTTPCRMSGNCFNHLEIGTLTEKARKYETAGESLVVGETVFGSVTGITSSDQPGRAQVEFTTVFTPNDLGLALGLLTKTESHSARARKYDDGWRMER